MEFPKALRQLAEWIAAMVRQGRITLAPGLPVTYAHRELSRLDELIARRQKNHDGAWGSSSAGMRGDCAPA
jgi:hypothetical protein